VKRKTLRALRAAFAPAALAALLAGGVLLSLSGCSSGGTNPVGNLPEPIPSPVVPSGTFYGASKAVGASGEGRGFVTLQDGAPVEIGFELTENVIPGMPELGFDQPYVDFFPLPAEANATPFKHIVLIWFSEHGPIGVGDVPHFHPLLTRVAPQQPSPNLEKERVPVDPAEIPADHGFFSNAVVPGVGQALDDPAEPPAQLGWNSTGYNYLFYNGHMNAISHGATHDWMNSRQSRGGPIKQPQIYPVAGYYPFAHDFRWNEQRRTWQFVWSDWRAIPAHQARSVQLGSNADLLTEE
jgi:hypothetical protein